MAGYLIDSHIFLWALESPTKLFASEREVLTDASQDIVVSVASIWELSIKATLGKLAVPGRPVNIPPDHFERSAKQLGIPVVGIEITEAEYVRRLPPIHRDPFDRILIAQALLGGRRIITRDAMFARYPGVQVFAA